jgi:hypothetical protein
LRHDLYWNLTIKYLHPWVLGIDEAGIRGDRLLGDGRTSTESSESGQQSGSEIDRPRLAEFVYVSRVSAQGREASFIGGTLTGQERPFAKRQIGTVLA